MAKKSITLWEARREGFTTYALRADGKVLHNYGGRWTLYHHSVTKDPEAFKTTLARKGWSVVESPGAAQEFNKLRRQRTARGSRKRL